MVHRQGLCDPEAWVSTQFCVVVQSIDIISVELLEIEEPCTHETQFGGLCVECGKDMTEVSSHPPGSPCCIVL